MLDAALEVHQLQANVAKVKVDVLCERGVLF
jgi:hypothetical protein